MGVTLEGIVVSAGRTVVKPGPYCPSSGEPENKPWVVPPIRVVSFISPRKIHTFSK